MTEKADAAKPQSGSADRAVPSGDLEINRDLLATRTASPSAMAPQVGHDRTKGATTPVRDPARYQMIGEHGRGGLGRVSRAHDLELGRDVAIKELISRASMSELRFVREALITARLEHPGIVPVHEAGRWPDGTPFYAMKLVAGRPLRDLIAERDTVEQRIGLLHHVIAVADAIAYAHGRNIIHRDLKPANVIVGDFGETIVIDWGLAKDLSSDESEIDGGPFRTSYDDDLTVAGSVLGTPAYMSPEQARGERVDQRTDVFAIGAMLWELCALRKVPPADRHVRYRLLRRAAIDRDLITIIDKALAPDSRHRYPDAGALAADLKAFKSGARIAARSYSVFAAIAHWIRRHRALASAIVIVAAMSVAASLLYVRNISTERDRADLSESAARASLNDLTLRHAELLLTTDPSAALDLIMSYQGEHLDRASQIRAEALGRGVAILKATPHTDAIRWIQGIAGGAVITVSVDGTIARTFPSGKSDVIASGVKSGAALAYATSRHLLAYVCDPDNLCVLDIVSGKHIQVESRHSHSLIALSFSPDEAQLALLSSKSDLSILDVSFPQQPSEAFYFQAKTGGGILFLERNMIAIGDGDGTKVIHTDGSVQTLDDPDGSLWDIGPNAHQLTMATVKGEAYIANTSDLRVVVREQLCHDSISGLKSLPQKGQVAFACKEGTIGVWDPGSGTVTVKAHLDGHASLMEVSRSGDYIVAAGNKGVLSVIDLQTNIATPYTGQGFRITAISSPTSESPLFLSGDMRGGIRSWKLPGRQVRVLADAHQRVYSTMYATPSRTLLASNRRGILLSYTSSRTIQQPIDTFAVMTNAESVVLAARDGGIWMIDQTQHVTRLRAGGTRVTKMLPLSGRTSVCIGYADGTSLVIDARSGQQVELFRATDSIRDAAVSNDDHTIALVDSDNKTHVGYHAGGAWAATTWTTLPAPVRKIALTRDGILVAICTDGGVWAHSTISHTWLYLLTSSSELTQLEFDDTETSAFIFDIDGNLMSVDINVVRFALTSHGNISKELTHE